MIKPIISGEVLSRKYGEEIQSLRHSFMILAYVAEVLGVNRIIQEKIKSEWD